MSAMRAPAVERWTTHDLEAYPTVEGNRYEIVEGELHVSSQPHWYHQQVCGRIFARLDSWAVESGHGAASQAPGVIFDDENAVAPDVVWVSAERLPQILGEDGKLHDAPDLVVEVLAPGHANARRDQEAKLRLYSVRGVREYWIADWQARRVQVYRRAGGALRLALTLLAEDDLASDLLPGFSVTVGRLFPG